MHSVQVFTVGVLTLCPCLQTTGKRLPEWGFKQLEAVTSKSADVLSSLWFLEELEVAGGANLSQPSSQSPERTGDSETSEQEGKGEGEGEGEESSTGGSDGMGVLGQSDEAESEGGPSTSSGVDAASEDAASEEGMPT